MIIYIYSVVVNSQLIFSCASCIISDTICPIGFAEITEEWSCISRCVSAALPNHSLNAWPWRVLVNKLAVRSSSIFRSIMIIAELPAENMLE